MIDSATTSNDVLSDTYRIATDAVTVLEPLRSLFALSVRYGYPLARGNAYEFLGALNNMLGFATELKIESLALLEDRGVSPK